MDCPARFGPFESLNLTFRVTIRGSRVVPADVSVTTRLIATGGDGREQVTAYANRWDDLEPGRYGRWVQLRNTEVYRYELSPIPQGTPDAGKPEYDFSKFDRIDVTVRVVARDGTLVQRTVASRRLQLEEIGHESTR